MNRNVFRLTLCMSLTMAYEAPVDANELLRDGYSVVQSIAAFAGATERVGLASPCYQLVDRVPSTVQEAEQLERNLRKVPTDSNIRRLLISYYAQVAVKTPASREACLRHILWAIRNKPESLLAFEATGSLETNTWLGSKSRKMAESAWKHQLVLYPRNAKVIGNAANFFR